MYIGELCKENNCRIFNLLQLFLCSQWLRNSTVFIPWVSRISGYKGRTGLAAWERVNYGSLSYDGSCEKAFSSVPDYKSVFTEFYRLMAVLAKPNRNACTGYFLASNQVFRIVEQW